MTEYSFIYEKIYKHMDLSKLYDLIRNNVRPLKTIRIDVRNAYNYVLAEDIYSPIDRPIDDLSHVDGFAVRYEDVKHASRESPVRLRIVKDINPRSAGEHEIREGEAVFVETGYPIPKGSDLVIPAEDVEIRDEYIIVYKSYEKYQHVFPRGTDYKAGSLVFRKGTRISPFMIKTMLDLGIGKIVVYDKPRVAIYSVGNELVDQPYDPSTGKLPTSTRIVDKYAVEYYGGIVIEEGKLNDDPGEIVGTIDNILDFVDMVITIGGVSMGPRDYSWISLYKKYKPRHYWRGLKIHPARSTSGLIIGDKIIINQPGLHQSSLSALILVITPILNYLQGMGIEPRYKCFRMISYRDYFENKMIDHYRVRPVRIINDSFGEILSMKGSYYLSPVNNGDAFTVLKPGVRGVGKGDVFKACIYEPVYKWRSISIT